MSAPKTRQRRPAPTRQSGALQRLNWRSPHVRALTTAAVGAIALLLIVLGQHAYVAWLAGWSVITFICYGYDKRQAQADGPRIPELSFHVMTLLGGFVGGWIGRTFWRHKTLHPSFLAILLISTVLHVALMGLLWPELRPAMP